jgi:hypothetical protein
MAFPYPSLPIRLCLGASIFLSLALTDLHRHGRAATRWKEYLFLLACVAAAILYGIVNDQITSTISWEYFYYGKELAPILGPQVPPDPAKLHFQAAKIGSMATWSAGLIAGVSLLIANNPSRRISFPQLTYRQLLARLPSMFAITLFASLLFGIAGRFYLLNWISEDFRDLAATNLWHPRNFLTVYGMHLGAYIGGAIATIYNVYFIRSRRKSLIIRSSKIETQNQYS